ncbi:UxaA family hydrolase [Brevundimonas sp. Root1279]|uniref:UxaA family hydrolase n=1 Tax=Brevundimonas sp. Root1279 TaxID=1736443 RepID=UPI0006F4B1F4|nr:UxaA family hydrolase [Brevundimonas sp. Root1279]KQW80791.1 altronate hydrolase [Brevundimonas sp. Root1279]
MSLSPVIQLHPDDNVLVCRAPVKAGDRIDLGQTVLIADADVAVGHKIARAPLAVGDKVLKYGAPIGSMTAAVAAGGHVHLHNMKSDYIASHGRDAASERRA